MVAFGIGVQLEAHQQQKCSFGQLTAQPRMIPCFPPCTPLFQVAITTWVCAGRV